MAMELQRLKQNSATRSVKGLRVSSVQRPPLPNCRARPTLGRPRHPSGKGRDRATLGPAARPLKEFPEAAEMTALVSTVAPLLTLAMGLRAQALSDAEFYRQAPCSKRRSWPS
jgi:hypothetical protein